MKIIDKYLFIQMLQIIFPIYIISFFFYIKKVIAKMYVKIKNKNIKIKKITNKITIYNYKKENNKFIVIINGGGLIFDDITDLVIINNLLSKLNNYNIIVISYNLFNKISDTSKEVNNTFKVLLQYNFNIEIFIGNSIGCTLLLELFKVYKQFTDKKVILSSPIVNFNVTYNKKKNNDFINYNFYNYVKTKYFDYNISINYDNLPKSLIICGSNELFYYDIIDFHKKCKNSELYCIKNGVHSEYIIYGLLNLPEIKNISNKIINFITNKNYQESNLSFE